ncbi:hypothetical protein [Parageobacillus thermoglucosidasius]|uniref:Uncharacterized protein n=1 Tax=Parageobacillus thermoglucosidasius TaxID=1426 RepID=A0AB38R001_PARTM|nr:hypothetical protein [Parageobacillus thermoglucosidasius]KYD16801.1 hypothetical protein B4168_3976 [Anoxybacillus flavithermus]REK60434.1 MAG: hypothetical protein C6P36_00010 [Geobacillus sp.]AEH49402.1 hypothetical protein Geoth_3558 [Parageobacillus thermoglucosidasius C56-YS93]MBY6270271.1 hypothetical protein [Parageobacillus thermoglucosidasius]MED4904561.1 hypothetical protein [Parageobacillus thermoglucosidasius]
MSLFSYLPFTNKRGATLRNKLFHAWSDYGEEDAQKDQNEKANQAMAEAMMILVPFHPIVDETESIVVFAYTDKRKIAV